MRKTIGRILGSLVVMCVLTGTASAGDVQTPGISGHIGTPGINGTIGTPGINGNIETPGISGHIGTPGIKGDISTPGATLTIAELVALWLTLAMS